MKQREVTDNENTRWTCVQAYSIADAKNSLNPSALPENEDGKVTVVCTPTGGAKTVRLNLPGKWDEMLKDEEVIEAIKTATE